MLPIINELFDRIKFNKDQVGDNAVTDLSFVLEMHAWHLSKEAKISRYESLVHQKLIDLDLDENTIKEVLDFLKGEIKNKSHLTPGLLFAMGQTSCDVGILPLTNVLESSLMDFGENEFYQALVSLEKLIFFDLYIDDKNRNKRKPYRERVSSNCPCKSVPKLTESNRNKSGLLRTNW